MHIAVLSSARASPVVRLTLTLLLPLALAGCGDVLYVGKLSYVGSPDLQAKLGDKPDLQKKVGEQLVDLFGPDPQYMKVPKGAGLPGGGRAPISPCSTMRRAGQAQDDPAGQSRPAGLRGRQPGRGLRPLPPPLPPLPRRLRRGRRPDRPFPLSSGRRITATAPSSSFSTICWPQADARRPAQDDHRNGLPLHVDAWPSFLDTRSRGSASGARLHDLPEHAGRGRTHPHRRRGFRGRPDSGLPVQDDLTLVFLQGRRKTPRARLFRRQPHGTDPREYPARP